MILDDGTDTLLMTETWLYAQGDEACIAEMTPRGYALRSFPRTGSRGGGIASIVRDAFCDSTSFKPLSLQSFEAVELHISGRNLSILVVCLYRPPPSRKNKLSNQLMLQKFPEFPTQFAGSHSDLVLLGDFNFHYDDCADTQVNHLKIMLSDHGLTQLVDVPTHKCGHILDCAVVRSDVSCLVLERVDDMPGLSDLRSLLCQMTITAPSESKRTVTSRNTKAVSVPDFQADVKCFADRYSQCPDRDLADNYSAGLRAVMDRHAPLVTRCISHRRSAPWLTDKVREARRRRRQAERRWRSIRLTAHREIFFKERATVKRCIRDARNLHYSSKIDISATTSSFLLCLTNCLAKQRLLFCHRTFPLQTSHSVFVTFS